jgi:phosphatidate cytidylyltransferase
LKFDGTPSDDLPTGEIPVVRPADPRVTISGAEVAAEAAGIPVPTPPPVVNPETQLPHWTEEPTGQIPSVLQRDDVPASDDPLEQIPAPVWREGEVDYTVHDETFTQVIAPPDTSETPVTDVVEVEETPAVVPTRAMTRAERLRHADQKLLRHRSTRPAPEKDVRKATVTGIIAALALVAIFQMGALAVAVLVTAALAASIAELFAAYRMAGTRPATLVGVAGTVILAISAYNRGETALGFVIFIVVTATFLWFLATPARVDMLDGVALTLMGFLWIGVLGNFAMLIISPVNFKDGHGLGILFGALVAAVANDTGALFVGKSLGRRKLAPTVSQNKTLEGFVGGAVVTVIVCAVFLPFLHPWSVGGAVALAMVTSIVGPMGDLFESLVKRSLGIKDMGAILPGHGGLVDRVDGILFVLPATYYLAHILNIG